MVLRGHAALGGQHHDSGCRGEAMGVPSTWHYGGLFGKGVVMTVVMTIMVMTVIVVIIGLFMIV